YHVGPRLSTDTIPFSYTTLFRSQHEQGSGDADDGETNDAVASHDGSRSFLSWRETSRGRLPRKKPDEAVGLVVGLEASLDFLDRGRKSTRRNSSHQIRSYTASLC